MAQAEYDSFFKVYDYAKGSHQVFIRNAGAGAEFICVGPFGKFLALYIDDQLVNASEYDAVEGSTKILLHQDYLEKLSLGAHTLRMEYVDGTGTTDFSISAAAPSKEPGRNGSASQKAQDRSDAASPIVKPAGTDQATPAQTSDNSNPGGAAAGMLAGLLAGGYVIYVKRKREMDI